MPDATPTIHVILADYDNPRHCADIVAMLDAYAQDPMGGGRPLPDDVKQRLIPGLKKHPRRVFFPGLS